MQMRHEFFDINKAHSAFPSERQSNWTSGIKILDFFVEQ